MIVKLNNKKIISSEGTEVNIPDYYKDIVSNTDLTLKYEKGRVLIVDTNELTTDDLVEQNEMLASEIAETETNQGTIEQALTEIMDIINSTAESEEE